MERTGAAGQLIHISNATLSVMKEQGWYTYKGSRGLTLGFSEEKRRKASVKSTTPSYTAKPQPQCSTSRGSVEERPRKRRKSPSRKRRDARRQFERTARAKAEKAKELVDAFESLRLISENYGSSDSEDERTTFTPPQRARSPTVKPRAIPLPAARQRVNQTPICLDKGHSAEKITNLPLKGTKVSKRVEEASSTDANIQLIKVPLVDTKPGSKTYREQRVDFRNANLRKVYSSEKNSPLRTNFRSLANLCSCVTCEMQAKNDRKVDLTPLICYPLVCVKLLGKSART